jgi:hypothetical protein
MTNDTTINQADDTEANPFMTMTADEMVAAIRCKRRLKMPAEKKAALHQLGLQAMTAAILRDLPGNIHTSVVEWTALNSDMSKKAVWEEYAYIRSRLPEPPAPAWVAEMNERFAVIEGVLMRRDYDRDGALTDKLRPTNRRQFRVMFSNKVVEVFNPRTGKMKRMSQDKAWMINPHRKIGR